MKTKELSCWLLILAAVIAIACLGFASGSMPGADAPAALGASLGAMSLLPIILAVALAFATGDVILSLFTGYIGGMAMLAVVEGTSASALPGAVLSRACRGIVVTASTWDNASVLILCVAVGGMVEVLRCTGGFAVLAGRLVRRINSPRKANIISQLFCTLFFFDDYANALISGPVLQTMTDKAGLSRARLSYIVDSTAAPVAGIAVVSSWVAVEVSVIDEGLALAGLGMSGFELFLHSIPYCFYCLFALAFMLLSSVMGREYGPMLTAEREARRARREKAADAEAENAPADKRDGRRVFVCVFSVALLLVTAMLSFYTSGRAEAVELGLIAPGAPFTLATVSTAVAQADTIFLVLRAALLCGLAAIALAKLLGLSSVGEGIKAWLHGAEALMPTIVILLLAWSLADVVKNLGTVYYVVEIISAGVPAFLVPSLIFVCCCLISFASGSYGCMFMVMPMAIPIASAVVGAENLTGDSSFLLLCVASVLSGSIFGDHCSPMTDCTVLAALGSGCNIMEHVRTQLPYAMTVAAVTIVFGTLLTALGVSVWLSLALGCAAMAALLLVIGKKP